MMKKLSSLLLTLAMCLTLLPGAAVPVQAYGDYYYGGAGEHTHYLCGGGSYYSSCTCLSKESSKTYFTQKLTQSDNKLKKNDDEWSATNNVYELKKGDYYLAGNLTLDHGISVTGDVKLCLNGYSITCNKGASDAEVPVITVKTGASFTLTNCQTYMDCNITHTEGKYGCGVDNKGTFNMYGGSITGNQATNGVGVCNSGTFNLYGGTISDNKAVGNVSTYNNGEGGGVLNNSSFYMSGGTISGNSAGYGGGVYSFGSGTTFTMSGGVIGGTKEDSGNTAKYYGGGVSNQSDSIFTMTGGLIAGNKVTDSGIGVGGGVYNNATSTISGGKIGGSEAGKNTSANRGGGVYTSGTFTMTQNAEVSYNTTEKEGGGVYNNRGVFSLTDGRITNNTAATGGGVYCDRSDEETGTVTLAGKARIADNKANAANSNLYLLRYGTVSAVGLSAGAGIGVSTEVDVAASQINVAVTSDAVSANYFTSDNSSYETMLTQGVVPNKVGLTQRRVTETHSHGCVCGTTHKDSNGHNAESNLTNWVGVSDLNLITGAGNYYLTKSVTLTEAFAYGSSSYYGWKVPDGVVLCLNGNNITMQNPDGLVYESGSAKNADVILVTGRFTLTDCKNDEEQGKITHEKDKMGRGIEVLGGTFDMYGGQIAGNTTTEYGTGGGVHVEGDEDPESSSTFNLYGGSINSNRSGYGGGVYVSRVVWEGKSQFNMYGGSINGNASTVTGETSSYGIGGGVCVNWTAAFKMTGGSITNNTAKFDGAGVYLSALARSSQYDTGEQRTAKFEVSGSPSITGNKVDSAENNVYLDTDTTDSRYTFNETVDASITILDGLEDTAKIGVTAKKTPATGARVLVATGATKENYDSIFTSDNQAYEVQKQDSTLKLAVEGDTSEELAHKHSWTYAIKAGTENTIVATCSAANCPNPNGGSVTLNAPAGDTLTYDGTAKAATLTNELDSSSGITAPTITYSKEMDSAPVDAGNYTASITLGETTASVKYTINTATVVITALNKSANAGDAAPDLSSPVQDKDYTVTGLVGRDDLGGTIKLAYANEPDMTKDGETAINISGAEATSNYTIKYVEGKLTVSADSTDSTDSSSVRRRKRTNTGTVTGSDDSSKDSTAANESTTVPEQLEDSTDYASCPKDKSCPLNSFADIDCTAWYHDGVHYCIENGLMKGYDNGSFGTDNNISRSQFVTILWRIEGSPVVNYAMQFADVPAEAWFTEAVRWAVSNNIVSGYDDTAFGPNDTITREQLAVILYRYAQFKGNDVSVGEDTNILDFDDARSISSYAVSALQWACGSGIITGTANTVLNPAGAASRTQAACMMQRFLSDGK